MTTKPECRAQLLRELGRFCENSPLEGALDIAGRAYTAAAEEEAERRGAPTLELVVKPCGDCWLYIKAPSGNQAAINLGQRGSFNDQTFFGSVILEVAELTQHRRQPLRFGGGEG